MAEVSGTGLAASAVGLVFLWSAVKGASIADTIRSLIKGEQPAGTDAHPVTAAAAGTISPSSVANTGVGAVAAGARSGLILGIAASKKGQRYCWGGGHGSKAATSISQCVDCSGYVSEVLNEAGLMKGTAATSGLARMGKSVPYAQRAPGDVIVWTNGVTGHTGIIIDNTTFWNNPCTACGGVQISHYPYGSRTAAAAIIRRFG
jgi:cell wall-associated NlpC family hydrolase